jgi:hypothetical protein
MKLGKGVATATAVLFGISGLSVAGDVLIPYIKSGGN